MLGEHNSAVPSSKKNSENAIMNINEVFQVKALALRRS